MPTNTDTLKNAAASSQARLALSNSEIAALLLPVVRANVEARNYHGARITLGAVNPEIRDLITAQLSDDERTPLGLLTREAGRRVESDLKKLITLKFNMLFK